MRKTYQITVKLNGEESKETTYYRFLKEEEGRASLSTFIKAEDVVSILEQVTKDVETDCLLEHYVGSGKYELKTINLKHKNNGAVVYLNFNAI